MEKVKDKDKNVKKNKKAVVDDSKFSEKTLEIELNKEDKKNKDNPSMFQNIKKINVNLDDTAVENEKIKNLININISDSGDSDYSEVNININTETLKSLAVSILGIGTLLSKDNIISIIESVISYFLKSTTANSTNITQGGAPKTGIIHNITSCIFFVLLTIIISYIILKVIQQYNYKFNYENK
ncbi:hypothetical protein A0H76_1856 [Hepatospora eriocheir]|uniref:Uncharacterized protein n=1 Tax=Hepatospora eriocheir TaxID=1081669 RepID=A0A1X0QKI6_9MICR|nr:hypothetical protein A0H76_1856 [Hepatospora eriocheir]